MKNKTRNSLFIFTLLCAGFSSHLASAQVEETITIQNGELDIPIMRYEAFEDDAPILLWLPSARGTSPKQAITANALADIDIETWVVDLHLAYFVDPGRRSVEHFNIQDIAELISIASKRTTKKIYLLATDRMAAFTLRTVAKVQQLAKSQNTTLKIGGVILFHPFLTSPTTTPGSKAKYLPVAKNSTIPIYYVQPSISTRQWHSKEAVKILQSGGSQVFFHPMPGISAGYHLRPDDDLNDKDLEQRAHLAQDLKSAIQLLSLQPMPPTPKTVTQLSTKATLNRYGLKSLNNHPAKSLKLNNVYGLKTSISYDKHKLSLVSFWASWCEPCIKELPALRRLYDDYHQHGLRIITVNVGETRAQMQDTLAQFKMQDYTNLSDLQGITMTNWNVYGFPTNFLIDQQGKIILGSFGAVAWDDAEVRKMMTPSLDLTQN